MKLAYAISLSQTSFKATIFDRDLGKYLHLLKHYGYDGVELGIRDPIDIDKKNILSLIEKYQFTVPAIGTGQAFIEDGLSLSHIDKEIRNGAVIRLKDQIRIARFFNALVIIGLIRGRAEVAEQKDKALFRLKESLSYCLDFAEKLNIKLVIEPINRYETDLINSLEEALDFVESLGSSNLGLLLDTFHMNIEEKSFSETIIKAKEYLWHMHFADSNRYACGWGHINFLEVIDALKNIQYSHFLSAEVLPYPDAENAIKQNISFLKSLIPDKIF